jgi:hypothetical protein
MSKSIICINFGICFDQTYEKNKKSYVIHEIHMFCIFWHNTWSSAAWPGRCASLHLGPPWSVEYRDYASRSPSLAYGPSPLVWTLGTFLILYRFIVRPFMWGIFLTPAWLTRVLSATLAPLELSSCYCLGEAKRRAPVSAGVVGGLPRLRRPLGLAEVVEIAVPSPVGGWS